MNHKLLREIPISELSYVSGVVLPLVSDALKSAGGEDTEKKTETAENR